MMDASLLDLPGRVMANSDCPPPPPNIEEGMVDASLLDLQGRVVTFFLLLDLLGVLGSEAAATSLWMESQELDRNKAVDVTLFDLRGRVITIFFLLLGVRGVFGSEARASWMASIFFFLLLLGVRDVLCAVAAEAAAWVASTFFFLLLGVRGVLGSAAAAAAASWVVSQALLTRDNDAFRGANCRRRLGLVKS